MLTFIFIQIFLINCGFIGDCKITTFNEYKNVKNIETQNKWNIKLVQVATFVTTQPSAKNCSSLIGHLDQKILLLQRTFAVEKHSVLIHLQEVTEIHVASHIGILLHLELWSCNTLCHFCGGSLNIVLGFHYFPSPSFCPQHPRLVFPPTLPIILDVITHYNVTHKGKRLLCLETDLPRTNSSLWLLGKRKCLESLSCH